ncbi:hypothetical protein BN2476_500175 [Paraburkholderia piptadeniae]|uniref:Uncharacterized protein n=1 Tax=Paraburkholderia piptadeniae TaxID=1701573 RepID=A0A1N7SG25_9BURK|nr:hypothetical protein BN2476_500175 [Paraburkholderia piptadeniae]
MYLKHFAKTVASKPYLERAISSQLFRKRLIVVRSQGKKPGLLEMMSSGFSSAAVLATQQ